MGAGEETTRRSAAEPTSRVVAAEGQPEASDEGLDLLGRGDRLGRYLVLERIGHGGMGSVYLALDGALERKVAIKVLHPDVVAAAAQRQQLVAEAKAMALLAHPNVVTVHEAAVDRGRVYLAMEYVPGRNLRAWLADRTRAWPTVAEVLRQAALGLAAAHAAGLVHRDVKPDNILVGNDDRVRITDFGIAIDLVAASSDRSTADDASPTDGSVAALSGTPAYMSPEQLAGRPIDARADQFSFGVAAFEALYGQRPFVGKSARDLRHAHRDAPRPPAESEVPSWLAELVLRAMTIDPAGRWPAMDDVAAAITRGLSPVPRRLWRIGVAIAIPLAGLGIAIGGRLASAPDACAEASAIERAWSDERRGQVVAALSSEAFAADAAHAVAGALDAYASRWSAEFRGACERNRSGLESDGLFDRRQTCLGSRRRAFAALVDVLAEADLDARHHAVEAVSALPQVRDCEAARLVDENSWATPDEPERRARYEALEDLLVHAQALYDTGRLRDGDADLDGTLAAVREFADDRLSLRALLLRAAYRRRLDRSDDAAAAIDEAWQIALRIGDSMSAVLAAIQFIEVHGYVHWRRTGARERAELRVADARALVERVATVDADLGTELLARLLQAQARLELRFDTQRSLETSRAALAAFRRLPQGEPLELARFLSSTASVESAAGDRVRARALYDEALTIHVAAQGPEHPDAGTIYNNLGLLDRLDGDDAAAITNFERAASIAERWFGAEHSSARMSLTNLAVTLHRARAHAQAVVAWQRAYRAPETPNEVDWSTLARATEYAIDLDAVGRTDEALRIVGEAIVHGRAALGARVPATSESVFTERWNDAHRFIAERLDAQGRGVEAAAARAGMMVGP